MPHVSRVIFLKVFINAGGFGRICSAFLPYGKTEDEKLWESSTPIAKNMPRLSAINRVKRRRDKIAYIIIDLSEYLVQRSYPPLAQSHTL